MVIDVNIIITTKVAIAAPPFKGNIMERFYFTKATPSNCLAGLTETPV